MEHEPVLATAVVDLLAPALANGGAFVDATLGRGGHAVRILERAPTATLVGIDKDPRSLEASGARLARFGERVRLVHDDFARLTSILERLGIAQVAGVLFDLGVASPQLDDAARGFSFRSDGPLDMRMDPTRGLAAADVVNTYDERRLARLIQDFGEERFGRRIARAIVRARPLHTTGELAAVVKEAIPAPARRTGPHPARRTFQAIRIEVNGELRSLERALPQSIDALRPGGRVVVISYHSLEDRLVKRHFATETGRCECPPRAPVCTCGARARIRVLTRRPLRAPEDEVARNPRASAAKLRAAERLEAA